MSSDSEQGRDVPRGAVDRHVDWLDELSVPVDDVVLLLAPDPESPSDPSTGDWAPLRVAASWRARYPGAKVLVLWSEKSLPERVDPSAWPSGVTVVPAPSEQSRVDRLRLMPRPQVLIDAGNPRRAHKVSSLRQLLVFVAAGGAYVVEQLDAIGDADLDDRKGADAATVLGQLAGVVARRGGPSEREPNAVRELGAAVRTVRIEGDRALLLRSEVRYWVKLRDWQTDETLDARFGGAWGSLVEQRPATRFVSRAPVYSYGEGPIAAGSAEIEVPIRYLRRYQDVVATARQILRYQDYVLPDSWRHPHQSNLNNRQLAFSSKFVGRYLDRTEPTSVRTLEGPHYYLDTELPGHFGHITTDVISRVWGWRQVLAAEPDLRCLVSVVKTGDRVPGYQQQILAALGIPADRLEVVGPREAVHVPVLYGPTPQFENPHYVDPALGDLWAELAQGLPAGAPATDDKIFVSRRPHPKRHCAETPEIERFFAGHGFRVLFPEELSYPDQKMIFARARVIAGFGGSGLFNMMFAPGAKVIIVSGDSYNAHNERLIGAVNGNEMHYFWGKSEIPMPETGFSLTAFTSGWNFDLRRHRRALKAAIR